MDLIKKTFQYGADSITLETGSIARQATAAVMVRMGKATVVLVTVVANKEEKEGIDFFPLTVNYQERNYATGRVPGGYFKREGRPTEKETLTSRLMDRPLRPLFPEGFYNEVQIIATVLSADNETDPDIASLLGASAALAISGIPFNGPIGAARVGYINNAYVLNPTYSQLEQSSLDLVVAGTRHAVLMVESEAKELSEEVMLESVMFGHKEMQTAIKAIEELAEEVGKAKWDWKPTADNHELQKQIDSMAHDGVVNAYRIHDKTQRLDKLSEIRKLVVEKLSNEEAGITDQIVKNQFEVLESRIVRGSILATGFRIDGRDTKTVRPIRIETGLLPRTHGSALFTRGETQALVVTTLGTKRDGQLIDALEGQIEKTFMLHYNFPPYSVGETGMVGSPKRREIGHGRLALRSVQAVLPNQDEFPYVIRVVSEITESNGSSSMATVCGTSLSLMDAGVPVKAPVAGIAMGLIKEGDKFAILSDILGDEDHLGDMDFKVAGTTKGVTALQMDIKIEGITHEIMEKALHQAKEGRMHILGIMNQILSVPRPEMSDYAPRILSMKINPEKIRDVIGKGGATIRAITEETGTTIDITDDGIVKIASVDNAAAQAAFDRIQRLTAEVEVGAVYEGTVAKIMDFGAFVTILPGKDGLVHISQISKERIQKVTDKLSEGQSVKVKVLEIDKQGKIRLSIKDVEAA